MAAQTPWAATNPPYLKGLMEMAKRAIDGFVTATAEGKLRFDRNQVVPDKIAKNVAALVYDDGAPPVKKSAAADA